MPVTIRNKDRLFQKLTKLVPAIGAAVADANKQSAEEMVELARRFAPVKTGKLRDSIHYEPAGQPGSFRVVAGGEATTKEARAGSGAAYDYALGVEFGTKAHVNAGEFKGSENPGVHRQPFFFPAFRVIRKKMRSRAGRAISKAIKAAAT